MKNYPNKIDAPQPLFKKNLQEHDSIVVMGATATGKTALACKLARRLNGEIISADSRQVYKGLDLGTGKDLSEYSADGDAPSIKYHLIDVTDLSVQFNVFEYTQLFKQAFSLVNNRGKLPIIVGGTGLYIDALVRGYVFNGAGNKITGEPLIHPLIIGITYPRPVLRKRIHERLVSRINDGMIDEVDSLAKKWGFERLELLGLEYRYCSLFLKGEISTKDELIAKLSTKIGQFAKRQETWFRFMEKNGVHINWLSPAVSTDAQKNIDAAVLDAEKSQSDTLFEQSLSLLNLIF